jgi:rhodanese-related sulfurtransferase
MTDKQPTQVSDKLIVAAVATFVLGTILYFALGMPGMNHGSNSSMDGMDMSSDSPTHRIVDPAGFATSLAQQGAIVINVHVPYDGEIDGTHLFMPFDEIDAAALPEDRGTPLMVYCRSGSMSSTAVVALAALGYTNIVELDGGMNAWRAVGYSLRMSPSSGG